MSSCLRRNHRTLLRWAALVGLAKNKVVWGKPSYLSHQFCFHWAKVNDFKKSYVLFVICNVNWVVLFVICNVNWAVLFVIYDGNEFLYEQKQHKQCLYIQYEVYIFQSETARYDWLH
jgi:hypothetical protein